MLLRSRTYLNERKNRWNVGQKTLSEFRKGHCSNRWTGSEWLKSRRIVWIVRIGYSNHGNCNFVLVYLVYCFCERKRLMVMEFIFSDYDMSTFPYPAVAASIFITHLMKWSTIWKYTSSTKCRTINMTVVTNFNSV